jgi:uncharacterized membrane protein YesL
MVVQAIGTFLVGSLASSASGEGKILDKLVTIALLATVAFIIIMIVNSFCYFSPSCTNIWDVLIPDWLEIYLGDTLGFTETEAEQNKILRRLAGAGLFGAIPAILIRTQYIRTRVGI